MRQFQNSVLDFKLVVTGAYESAPLEAAWASEAMFFLRLEESRGEGFAFHARAQISVDGVNWIDEGTEFPPLAGDGQYVIRLKHFGGWLRLVGEVAGAGSAAEVTTNLVLKE
jgi:hypothetical protein